MINRNFLKRVNSCFPSENLDGNRLFLLFRKNNISLKVKSKELTYSKNSSALGFLPFIWCPFLLPEIGTEIPKKSRFRKETGWILFQQRIPALWA
jgi:hypothetical protein